ncbi:MAG: hypothetical protein JEZ10_03050 [Verrucomicrobia bacterium]|nr:hypothetical protein [Verrucomicrobiota bacterium]
MKTLRIILIVLLVIIALLGVGLQIFLTKGLTTALNDAVFPAVKSMYGLDMSIENASVNLFKGSATLQGFAARNLKGYQEPMLLTFDSFRLEIEMMSLLKRDPIIIKLAEAAGATLVVERNKERTFNVKELADALKPIESAEAPEAAQPKPAAEKAEPVPVHIRRIAIDATVLYVDSKRGRNIPLNLRLTGSDLFTIPAAGQPDSLLVLRGTLADDKNSFVTDLNAIIKPLTDPANPTFNATGNILDIDAEFLKEFLSDNEMSSGPFSIKPSITCNKGQLKGSSLDITLADLKIYGEDIGDTTLTIPVSGTLRNRNYEITSAIQSLASKQSASILKAIGMKELGLSSTNQPGDLLMQGLTNNVKEIAGSPELQKLIQQVVPGAQPTNTSTTNPPLKKAFGDVLFEQLEKNVKEVKPSDTEALKGLFNNLLGK